MCNLKTADKVVCINNTPTLTRSGAMPELETVYTVESVRQVGLGFSIRLVELAPECHAGGSCRCGECGWDSLRFRKAVRRGGSKLAIFHALLESTRPARPLGQQEDDRQLV